VTHTPPEREPRRRDPHPPERTLVTRDATSSPLVVVRELAEHTAVGDSYLGSLLRAQLRTSLFTAICLAIFLLATPAVFALVGTTRTSRVFGVTLPWVVLGVVIYPFLIVLAHRFIKRAESNEDKFEELVRPISSVDQTSLNG
jgi:hypothetical protein